MIYSFIKHQGALTCLLIVIVCLAFVLLTVVTSKENIKELNVSIFNDSFKYNLKK
jgi:hypothetical protein